MYQAATMQFEANAEGVKFLRGRINGKGNPWGKKLKIGRVELERDTVYPLTTAIELTTSGIRVDIYPVQPIVERVVKGLKVPTLVLVERQRTAKEEAGGANLEA